MRHVLPFPELNYIYSFYCAGRQILIFQHTRKESFPLGAIKHWNAGKYMASSFAELTLVITYCLPAKQ